MNTTTNVIPLPTQHNPVNLTITGPPNTIRARKSDLNHFYNWLPTHATKGKPINSALSALVCNPGAFQGYVAQYAQHLRETGNSGATISRHISTLKTLVASARKLGLANYTLEIKTPKTTPYRDTRGPGLQTITNAIKTTATTKSTKAKRDHAIIRLLFDLGLRRAEITNINVEDITNNTILITNKGHVDKTPLTLPTQTKDAINSWLQHRPGPPTGPLFITLDNNTNGARLSTTSVWRITTRLGMRPHGIRHTAITTALQATNGNIRATQLFARHSDPRTTTIYDDNHTNTQGLIAQLIANTGDQICRTSTTQP